MQYGSGGFNGAEDEIQIRMKSNTRYEFRLAEKKGVTVIRRSWEIERWQCSLWSECIRPGTPLSIEDTRRTVKLYEDY